MSVLDFTDDLALPITVHDAASLPAALARQHAKIETPATVNPLLALVSPVLTSTTSLSTHLPALPLPELLNQFTDKIKTFENNAYAYGYRSQIILAARYFLCATIDELMFFSDWNKAKIWQENSLLALFQRDAQEDERFFMILARGAEEPTRYIDVLELGYICLSLGYQGHYRKPGHQQELNNLIDRLYDLIRQVRGEPTKPLLNSPSISTAKKSRFRWRPPAIWLTVLLTVAILSALFLPYYRHLSQIYAPVQQILLKTTSD